MGYGYFDINKEKLACLFKSRSVVIVDGVPEDARVSHIRSLNNGEFRIVFESKTWDTDDPKKIDPPGYERID